VILIDARSLPFLRAGRAITITSARGFSQGRDYAAGTSHRHAILRVRILSCSPAADGFVLEVCQHLPAPERYLARNPGAQRRDYVDRPGQAARGEGAAVERSVLEKWARQAFERDDQLRRARAQKTWKRRTGRYSVPELTR
jgi:hypothetical protein